MKLIYSVVLALCVLLVSCEKESSSRSDKAISVTAAVAEDHLLYYFPFDGSSIETVSNNPYNTHGSIYGKDRFGHKNSALCLDGIDDYMDFNNSLYNKKGTISFWMYAPQQMQSFNGLIVTYIPGSAIGTVSALGIREGKFFTTTQFKWQFSSNKNVSVNKWCHVVLRWDDTTKKIDLIIDNLKDIATDYNDPNFMDNIINPDDPNGAKSALGLYSRYPGSHEPNEETFTKVQFDDLRGYDSWLSDEQVEELFYETH